MKYGKTFLKLLKSLNEKNNKLHLELSLNHCLYKL